MLQHDAASQDLETEPISERPAGPHLRARRREFGFTQAQLAAQMGVSRARVQAIENQVSIRPTTASEYLGAVLVLARDLLEHSPEAIATEPNR